MKYLDGRQVAYFTFLGTNKEISGSAQVTAKVRLASDQLDGGGKDSDNLRGVTVGWVISCSPSRCSQDRETRDVALFHEVGSRSTDRPLSAWLIKHR